METILILLGLYVLTAIISYLDPLIVYKKGWLMYGVYFNNNYIVTIKQLSTKHSIPMSLKDRIVKWRFKEKEPFK